MSRKLILLIEHDVSIRLVLQICLNDLGGWDVIPAESPQAGLELLQTQDPDAVIVDAFAPKIDGLAFLRQIEKALTRSIPILLITIKASWFTPQELQGLGVAGAIAKPFDPISLPRQIAILLGWNTIPE